MGWGRTFLLGDIGNRLDIDDVERDIDALRRSLRGNEAVDASQRQSLGQLQREHADLKLYLASLVRLLLAKGVLDEQELTRFVDLIDDDNTAT